MPHDPDLLARARAILAGTPDLSETKMFGGIAFMHRGNMACGLMSDGGFMARVHPDRTEQFLGAHSRVMTQKNRVMRGFIVIDPAGVATDDLLRPWIAAGLAHTATLPAK